MAENEVQLDLKKRARRRLVGAVALALLAAIVLPMVMDSEPRPDGDELSIRIPSQEGANYASRLITGTAPQPLKPVMPAASEAPPAAAPSPIAPAQATLPSPSASAPPASSGVTGVSSSSAKAEAEREEAARAREILEGRAAASAVSAKIFVQLGVYREEANARDVVAKAAAAGVKAGVEKNNGRSRVRAGPYPDRAAAEKVILKLKKSGLSGIVTSK